MAYGEASNAVLNNEASAIQDERGYQTEMEMSDEEMDKLLEYLDKNGLEATAEAWGMTPEEVYDIYPAMELLDSKENDESSKAIDLSMPEDGKFAELTDEQIDNIQNFIPAARLGKVVKAGKSMFGDAMNKLFSSKALKTNQLTNRGSTGEVVKGASRKLKDSNLRPSITNKTADRYKSMSDRVKTKRAVELGTAGTAATLIGLSGDDDEIVTGHPPVNDPYEKPKTQSRNLKGNRDEEGNFIDLNKIAREDDTVGVEEPEGDDMPEYKDNVPETMGNQFGYHKREGQNFWTVNNDDPYWDTHVMGTGDAWSDADAKEEVQELDWSSWFK